MYINKNKGTTLVEMIVVFFIITIILQTFYIYIRHINIENKRVFKKIQEKMNSEIIFNKIQNSMYESYTYKIYQYSNMPKVIDYSRESLKEGNMLLIEKYIAYQDETEIEIYYQTSNLIKSYYGLKNTQNEIRKIEGGDTILSKVKIRFYLKEYGANVEGFYFSQEYKKELKR